MQQKQSECKASRHTQLFNQSASSRSRHNKNHVLPKHGTMLKSIPRFGVGWGFWSRPTQPKVPRSVQICIWGEGGWSRPTQPKVPRSVQICIFRGQERGGGPDQLNPKCRDLSKSAFSVVGEGVVVQTDSTQSTKICPNPHFWWGEGVVVQTNIPEILEWGHSRNFEPKILVTGMCSASQIVCGD